MLAERVMVGPSVTMKEQAECSTYTVVISYQLSKAVS